MARYFAIATDEGIVVRQSDVGLDGLQYPEEWREVHDIGQHVNERGLDELARGKRIVFDEHDISFPSLCNLFAD